MKHIYVYCLCIICLLGSCDKTISNDKVMSEDNAKSEPCPIIEKNDANVDMVNNLYVFIKSRPTKKYKTFDEPVSKNTAREIIDSGKKKRGLFKTLGGFAEGLSKNLSFQEQINGMTELTLELYPEADGVLFSTRLDQCVAFKFTED